ncbi:MAG: PAS domain S-box protein [Geobacteraceae bacterium]|nr:PAS domain S-box protein [Geobacteraceae bacterium]
MATNEEISGNGGGKRAATAPANVSKWLDMFTEMMAVFPCPVYFKDIRGRYRLFNAAFERFLGLSGEEIRGKRLRQVSQKGSFRLLETMDRKLIRNAAGWQCFQTSHRDASGKEWSVIINKSMLFLHGEVRGIMGVITDVTELEETKRELYESRKILQNVFEAIPDLLTVHDRNLRVVMSNWHGGYEYVAEELRFGHPYCYDAYYPGQGRPCEPCNVLEVFRTNLPSLTEKYNPRIGHMESRAFPVFDESGKTVMVAEYVRSINERKMAEFALSEANQRLNAIIASSPLPIIAMDIFGKVMLWNPAAEKTFGWKNEEVLNKEYPLFPKRRELEIFNLFKRLGKDEIIRGEEVYRQCKDGRPITLSRHNAPLRDTSGRITGTMAVLEDITERKQAENELKASEANYRAIFDGTNEAIFVLDSENGSIIDVNRKMCEMYGCSREEALRLDVEAFSAGQEPFTQNFVNHYVKKAVVGDSQMFEWLARRLDGSLFWVEVNIKKINLGGMTRALASVRDITERKIAEEAQRESEERFRRIFEQNEDPAMIICPETLVIIDVNPVLVKHYGFSARKLLREGPGLFLQEPELDRISQALRGITDAGTVQSEPLVTFAKNDDRIITSFKAKLIRARGVSYAYCTFRDITERLRIREETKKMQTKLLQTNKMAALGTLSSGIAHEINNPVNFILSNARMLHDAWQDLDLICSEYGRDLVDYSIGGFTFAEAREILPKLLDGIIDGSHRIRTILTGLREFAREEKTPPNQKVDVNSAIEKSVAILQNQIREYTNHFHLSAEPDLPPVRGSLQQLEQVVINLTMNALQSLPGKEFGVYISTYREKKSNCVVIKVRDQGVGMDQEVVKRIFDPFFTTRLESGGTGLGLSICYSILKEHQGAIEVESEPGKGTSVFVRIPSLRHREGIHEKHSEP